MKNYSISTLKEMYIKYFEDVPIQKYAAMYVGRDEDTIIRWKKEDNAFADAVQRAKAQWIRKRMISTKAEFALERLESEVFSKRTVEDTRQIPQVNIVNYKDSTIPGISDKSLTERLERVLAYRKSRQLG